MGRMVAKHDASINWMLNWITLVFIYPIFWKNWHGKLIKLLFAIGFCPVGVTHDL